MGIKIPHRKEKIWGVILPTEMHWISAAALALKGIIQSSITASQLTATLRSVSQYIVPVKNPPPAPYNAAFHRNSLTTHLEILLEENSFVRCPLVDFSKAFDDVRHSLLLSKISRLNIPSYFCNWIVSFFTGHSQVCRITGGALSTLCQLLPA